MVSTRLEAVGIEEAAAFFDVSLKREGYSQKTRDSFLKTSAALLFEAKKLYGQDSMARLDPRLIRRAYLRECWAIANRWVDTGEEMPYWTSFSLQAYQFQRFCARRDWAESPEQPIIDKLFDRDRLFRSVIDDDYCIRYVDELGAQYLAIPRDRVAGIALTDITLPVERQDAVENLGKVIVNGMEVASGIRTNLVKGQERVIRYHSIVKLGDYHTEDECGALSFNEILV